IPAMPVAIPHSDLISETWELYKRALLKLMRRPIVLYFSLLQPAIWLLLFGQIFSRMVTLPGASSTFGTSNYMAFFAPGVIMMTMLFGAGQTGLGLIQDMDSGFLDKLLTTPINRFAILLGKMGGDLTRMVMQSLLVVLIAVAAGVHIHTGLLGVFFIVVISGMFGMALAGINTMIALYTRNTEATFLLGNFVNLPLMFTSTAMMPKSFLPDWMQKIVVINPITYGIEGMRGLITTGFDPNKVFPAVIILGSIAAVSIIGATLMFRRRVA
ncbi:MAG: ABC transporter permease, partial [Acidobacteriota bacterium]